MHELDIYDGAINIYSYLQFLENSQLSINQQSLMFKVL